MRVTELLVWTSVAIVAVLAVRSAVGMAALAVRRDPAGSLAGSAAWTGPDDVRDLGVILEPIRAKHKLPAMGAAVILNGQVVGLGVTGARKAGGTERVTLDDRFHLGSDTKAMTATLIGVLVEEGTLSWDTTVGAVFGAVLPDMDAGWKDVALESLLRNRGGAPADLDADGLWMKLWEQRGTPTEQRMQLVEGVTKRPPLPGQKFVYSNAGFAIAGAMAERTTGRAWEDLMQVKVFHPLGITTAGFGAPGNPELIDQPWGHQSNGNAVPPGPSGDNPPAIGPAGIVHMTIGDWAKFIEAHLSGDALSPERRCTLVTAETYDMLHRPVESYAMGWAVLTRPWASGGRPGDTGLTLTHAGSNTMWFCVAWLAPEKGLAVLITTNQGGPTAERGADAAAAALIREFSVDR